MNDKRIVTFLIESNDKIRHSRMRERGDKEDKIKQRLENDIIDFDKRKIGQTDFIINTDNKTIEETAKIIYEDYMSKLSSLKK